MNIGAPTLTELFWSKRGIVACYAHAPSLDSDEWRTKGWQRVPGWRQRSNATVLQCQFCHGRPYLRLHQGGESEALRNEIDQ